MALIEVNNLYKVFKQKENSVGRFSLLKDFFLPKYKEKFAVDNVSMIINKGELVGYIGPNGAGKSTTIKLLCGILTPTSGKILVNNLEPSKDRIKNSLNIGVVFGQRSQLLWDLPTKDTMELHKSMYKIPNDIYLKNTKILTEIFEIKPFINQPARQLSLGQRMRANLMLSILHNPNILYLDEPTIGLDILAKDSIRRYLKDINKEFGTTILLTTHDMSDIEELCSRIILIDEGKKIYDNSLKNFKNDYSHGFRVNIVFNDKTTEIRDKRFELVQSNNNEKDYLVTSNTESTTEILKYVINNYDIKKINVIDHSIENIVRQIYKTKTNNGIL